MAEPRRLVRPTTDFFQDLDRQLPAERGSDGRPSRSDFQAYELLSIIDRFATGFDDLPELIPGRPQYRLLIAAATIVSARVGRRATCRGRQYRTGRIEGRQPADLGS